MKIKNLYKKIVPIGICALLICSNSSAAEKYFTTSNTVSSDKYYYQDSTHNTYLRAHYDIGSWVPTDNATILSKAVGYKNNYAYVKFKDADYSSSVDFKSESASSNYSKEAKVQRWVAGDYCIRVVMHIQVVTEINYN